jgi:excisionase family DNA binding protein
MKLLTVKDVAQMLSLSPSTVYDMAGKTLRCVRIGGAIRFREEDIDDFISSRLVQVQGERSQPRPFNLKHIRL